MLQQVIAHAADYNYSGEVNGKAAAGALAIFGSFMIFFLLIILLLGGFTLWMLVDAIIRKDNEFPEGSGGKVLWILLIVFVGLVPAIIYFFIVKKKMPRSKDNGSDSNKKTPPPVK